MIKTFQKKVVYVLITLLGSLLFANVSAYATQHETNQTTINKVFITQGIVRRISLNDNEITVKPHKEPQVTIKVDGKTTFFRMFSLQDLEKYQRVRVWFTVIGERKRAIKIEKLPQVGC